MSAHVGILCSEEMFNWKDCVMKHISENLNNNVRCSTFTVEDYADKKKQHISKIEWSNAAALIIMVSPNFVESLKKYNTVIIPAFPTKAKMYFLFCGVGTNCLESFEMKRRFNNYESIQKYNHEGFEELMESLINTLFKTDLKHSDYSNGKSTFHQSFRKSDKKEFIIIPKYILIEKCPSTMIATFDHDLGSNEDISFEIEGVCEKTFLKKEQLAPNVFKFNLPNEISPGLGKINALVNNKRIGSQNFNAFSMTAHNQMFNILDSILAFVTKHNHQSNVEELDKVILKSLNSKQELFTENPETSESPLLHLTNKYNLKECYAVLSKIDTNKTKERGRKIRNYSMKTSVSTPSSLVESKFALPVPEHQKELIEILNKVKAGELNVDEAEQLFQYWNLRHEKNIKTFPKKANISFRSNPKIGGLPKVDELSVKSPPNISTKKISCIDRTSTKSPTKNLLKTVEVTKKDERRTRLSIPNRYSGLCSSVTKTLTNDILLENTNDTKLNINTSKQDIYENSNNPDKCLTLSRQPSQDDQLGTYVRMDKPFEPPYETFDRTLCDVRERSQKELENLDDGSTYDLSIPQNYENICHLTGDVRTRPPAVKVYPRPAQRTKFIK